MAKSIAARLRGMKKDYSAAKDREPAGFENLPDGMYELRLVSAEVNESGNGRLQVVFEYAVEGGDEDGRSVYDYQGIENEDGLFYLGRTLNRYEVDLPDDIEEIPGVVEALAKMRPLVSGQLRTKGEFQNLRIKKTLETSQGAGSDADDVVEDGDGGDAVDVGDRVTWDRRGTEMVGEITGWKGEKAIVKADSDGKKYAVALDALEPEATEDDDVVEDDDDVVEDDADDVVEDEGDEPEDDSAEYGEGDTVTVNDPDDGDCPFDGEVVSIDGDDVTVKFGDDEFAYSAEFVSAAESDEVTEDETEEEGEDEVAIDVGTRVTFESRGKTYVGEIVKFPSDTAANVKCDGDGKTRKVALDKCELAGDDDDVVSEDAAEPDPKPRKPAAKKTSRKAATPRKTSRRK